MTFSIVDYFLHGKCIYPERVCHVIYRHVADLIIPNDQWDDFQTIWLNVNNPTEAMIKFMIRHNIPFDCPVCGGKGVRQEWEINKDHYYLCDTPCYCQPESILTPRDCMELLP